MTDAFDRPGTGDPQQPAAPDTYQQQWWDWWWRVYGYQVYGYPQPPAQTQVAVPGTSQSDEQQQYVSPPSMAQPHAAQQYTAQPYPPPQYTGQPYAPPPFVTYPYAPYVPGQDELPARRRHRGLATMLVLLLLLVVVLPVTSALVLFVDDLETSRPTAGTRAAETGPLPSGDRRFTPSAEQRAYFLEIGPIADKGTRVAKWTRPTVRVAIVGPSRADDRDAVRDILATVNDTIDEPRFVYSASDPQIVISFLSHEDFQAASSRTDDTIGWCSSNYTMASHSITDARISIDDSPEFRSDREAVLSHEFGHALGLDDTRKSRYQGATMYFRVGGPRYFTRLDLAAIRMLYDSNTRAGATHRDLVRAWPKE